jgi:UDP-N-acetylglucosamine 2-epimerase
MVDVVCGLRSFNRRMPEEINRVVADQLSDLLFCPSQTAVDNLAREGRVQGVYLVGDVMSDALLLAAERASTHSTILEQMHLSPGSYFLATVHRAENTDDPVRLGEILAAFGALASSEVPIVFPVHPRTRKKIDQLDSTVHQQVRDWPVYLIDPVGYLDMVMLEQSARMILTDSGGIQKEAYWVGVPCITLRDETEWVETVQTGWNVVTGAEKARILAAISSWQPPAERPPLYGEGRVAEQCLDILGKIGQGQR